MRRRTLISNTIFILFSIILSTITTVYGKNFANVDNITVLNAEQTKPVLIREQPNPRSKVIGQAYGSLMEIKVLQNKGTYSLIQARDYNNFKIISGYVPTSLIKNVKPHQSYMVLVDLSEQKTYVYKDDMVIREMKCSTGVKSSPTPVGRFLIGDRGKYFYSPKYKQGAYNWVRFNKNYLFHSVPTDNSGKIIKSEEKKLGQLASHGCIRLAMQDSKWIYDNLPKGTLVIIQE